MTYMTKSNQSASHQAIEIQDLQPDSYSQMMERTQEDYIAQFYQSETVRDIVTRKRESLGNVNEEDASDVQILDDGDKKRALIVIGALTGNSFVDNAMHNTAREAESDFKDRGYDTDLINAPDVIRFKGLMKSGKYSALCFIGHGGDKKAGDSKSSTPGDPGGNDFLWINSSVTIDSGDIRNWLGKSAAMDVVILHACVQNTSNTAKRWQSAFGVKPANFYSWTGSCNYYNAYWWQYAWK